MCGIAGALGPTSLNESRIRAALATLGRRGPDARGWTSHQAGTNRTTLIHTRLAIIDLDRRADQPFEKDGLAMTYNGEIYNYQELRRDLEDAGIRFRTNSDTEVLLEAYRKWGPDCQSRLEGMWAFAVLDANAGTLFLSRDRFGEKPLYTWFLNGTLYFASEVKTLAALSGCKPGLNTAQILRYLINGYKFLHKNRENFYTGLSEFPPGCGALLVAADEPYPLRYWHLTHAPTAMTYDDALDGARERLFRSMELRLRADVPLAFCLSGGIDSATLAAIAVKEFGHAVHSFSVIDRDERYDETENIQTMVDDLGCPHHAVHTSTDGFFERMERLVAYHDAPVATISYYVHSFLSEAIHEAGYKVAVSGSAADEIFTGYYDHYAMWLSHMADQVSDTVFRRLVEDWQDGLGRFVQNPLLQDPLAFKRAPGQREHILLDQEIFESLLCVNFHEDFEESLYTSELLRNRMMNELFHESVPVLLHEDDRNSMYYSVENRSPFLDTELVEFLYTVPSEHLIGDGFAKLLLRSSGKGLVPDSVRLDKRKRGFNAAIDSLIDREDAETQERLMEASPIFEFIDREQVEGFLSRDMTSNSFSKFLFSFVSAKLFMDHHAAWDPLSGWGASQSVTDTLNRDGP